MIRNMITPLEKAGIARLRLYTELSLRARLKIKYQNELNSALYLTVEKRGGTKERLTNILRCYDDCFVSIDKFLRPCTFNQRFAAIFLCICTAVQGTSFPSGAEHDDPLGRQHFVDNEGIRIHYRSYGAGPLLILQHGFPDRETTWNTFQIQALVDKYTVVTPTLRGYPPSDVPPQKTDYTSDAYVSDMLAIVKATGFRSAIIVGHDVGGVVTQKFALSHPDLVDGLVMVNTPILPVFLPLIEFDTHQQFLSEYTIPYYEYRPGQPKNVSTVVEHILNKTYESEIAGYLQSSPLFGMLDFYNENFPAPPYGQNLSTVGLVQKVPSCILWGVQDPYFSPKMINNLEDWFTKGVRLVTIPDAGHWSFRDQPSRFNAELISFIQVLDDHNSSKI